jgi:hypothetical protein
MVSTSQILSIPQIQQLEDRVSQGDANPAALRLLGDNYAFVILGVTSFGANGMVNRLDPSLPASTFASHARTALQSSNLPDVIGEAATALWRDKFGGVGAMVPRELNADAAKLAAQLLDRAIALEPTNPDWRSLRIEIGHSNVHFGGVPAIEAYAQAKEDIAALSGDARYYALRKVAFLAELADKLDDAETLAHELIADGANRSDSGTDWNKGNAIQGGNTVLGKVALDRGDVAAAESFLIASAGTTGSPQLNSFGPNMSLAFALLKGGHRQAVLQYLELCRAFWKMGGVRLNGWIEEVANGKTPNFGGSLYY